MEDLDDVGGVPTVFGALGELLHGDARPRRRTDDGRRAGAGPRAEGRRYANDSDPVDAAGAFRVVRGNLAPDGALIKRSAATASLLRHTGPAFVMRDADEVTQRTGADSTRRSERGTGARAGPDRSADRACPSGE